MTKETDTIDDLLLEDSEAKSLPSNSLIASVADLATEAVGIIRRLEKYEQVAKGLKDRLNYIQSKELPDAMMEAGTSRFDTSEGVILKLAAITAGTLPKDPEAHEKALGWLRENGHGDLIKTIVKASYGRGAEELARHDRDALAKTAQEVEMNMGVHAQTLAKWAREMMAAGKPFPADVLGIYTANTVKITGL